MADYCARRFIPLLFLLSVAVYAFTYGTNRFGDPIRADGLGYYAYLPSVLIYHDPSFGPSAAGPLGGTFPTWSGIRPYDAAGHCLDRYTAGVAIMALPFFLVAHAITLLARAAGFPVAADGYSFFYQHGFGIAGVAYMVMGVSLLRRLLLQYYSTRVTLATLAALVFGTNLFHYGSGESTLSHAYSFFLFAGLLLQIPRWYEGGAGAGRSLLLGATIGFVALVRVPNLIVGTLFLLYGVTRWSDVRGRLIQLARRAPEVGLILLAGVVVIAPQLLLWHCQTGRWFVNGYGAQGEGFHFSKPETLNVLFSIKKGVFFWCPLLMLAVAGFPALRRRMRPWFWGVLAFNVLNLYVISSWWMWWFGGSFGHRAFIESYAVLAMPLAALYSEVRGRSQILAVGGFSLLCTAWTQHLAVLYYSRKIDYQGLDAQAVYDILWYVAKRLKSLFGR